MTDPTDAPFTFGINIAQSKLETYDNHIERRLSAMKAQYLDTHACETILAQEDPLLYQVYENIRPHNSGEVLHGLSVLHPGKVGNEYFMTKGHFHSVLETGEVYHCLKGKGMIVMETPEGDWAVEELRPNTVLYVPPRWAHRSVNTGPDEDLVTFFCYPGHSGHDYGTIETQGFRKLVVEENGQSKIIDNPRWQPPEGR